MSNLNSPSLLPEFGKRPLGQPDYNVYDRIYHTSNNNSLLSQATFNQGSSSQGLSNAADVVEKSTKVGSSVLSFSNGFLTVMSLGVLFTVVTSVIGYSYWDTTIEPFFATTLPYILSSITTLFLNYTSVYNLYVNLNYTVGNLSQPNFTLNGDAYFTNFNGSAPLFNNSATEVGSALNYLGNNDLTLFNMIAALGSPNAYAVSFNGSNPLFNTSASNVGTALNYLAANGNSMQLQINQILATPPSAADAYTTTFNGSNPLFNSSASNVGTALNYLASNDNALFTLIAQILATPPSTPNAYAVTYNGTSPNFVPAASTVGAALDYLGTSNTLLRARKDNNYYISVTYGSDITGDGSRQLPYATLSRALQASANTTNEFSQISFIFDNGLYSESNYIAIKPNFVFVANEIGVLLIFGAGAGLDGGSWAATGTGYVSFLRFGLLRCDAACNFDMSAAVPSAPIFSVFFFYNSSIELNAPMSFRRRADTTSYFKLVMESTVVSGAGFTTQDLTSISWTLSGDVLSNIGFSYNSSSTYSSLSPTISIGGMVAYGTNTIGNYAPNVTVDLTLLNYVSKSTSTMTIGTSSGTAFNVHGDVLSYGVINGGILTTGAGTTGFEYLTKAIGLGVDLTTLSDWDTPYPINQQEVNNQVASRLRTQETSRRITHGISLTAASATAGLNTCTFDMNLNSGTLYVVGASQFSPIGGSSLAYNGSTTEGFHFSFFATPEYTLSAPLSDNAFLQATISKNGGTVLALNTFIFPASGSIQAISMNIANDFFLNAGDYIDLEIAFTLPTATFTTCNLQGGVTIPYFIIEQFT